MSWGIVATKYVCEEGNGDIFFLSSIHVKTKDKMQYLVQISASTKIVENKLKNDILHVESSHHNY